MALIDLQKITKDYVNGDVVTSVLHGVSLEIEEGEFVAIMGPSGSGKSTLMHIIGFLDQLTTGKYLFAGKDVSKLSDDELAQMRRKEVGFVFQFFNLLPRTTVLENVTLPMVYEQTPIAEREKEARRALESVGLAHRLHHLSNQLSGGERQRVAIARALVGNPSIIFADEPTGNLDTKSGVEVLKLFQELNKQGNTIVMITHEREAAEFAERIISIRDGDVVQDGNGHKRRTDFFDK
ncbi:macrolide ABC transporter ATP-binding protein [Candidatus Uhrbacteria bacterium CG_4_9_14_0_2_um_filter_41_50]|uniref:Macrolide ABC transporter ATP-binding protein n=1 Tax=Candidatus Uhrbacteria bacterium CG_4_9_14_0_2_um_filter_41_50 TaxID=1975031 RepID=A0A2M8EPF7_9BACT|nr:MAG: macrolide ABC transporter ATP-binding protein [Candidatus Uhrbacteria bacterium CG_4_10_14_3_um_filter_41_21]PIZ54613.1 MAG: macrolide ABC transporter ATP-binding protein [Candidatus Uhrbacteria bacterium CG_4_10_14_0_2_um_filter_41_21]PJB84254.1 MAG: macrolide ABC transporter ATP-binding protein [Candidatus Uhrbacteria bacterium CG_4_9_14_0_8_um_filter_41_16]PJC24581.1 MAG: macrolide ABC transporter ATP-binding protein [Candidatus Uhrbacteria bacterium CG_4_9_14_0_2_um_filter_41_50]PJE